MFTPVRLTRFTREQVTSWKEAGIFWLWGTLNLERTDGTIWLVVDADSGGLSGYMSDQYGCDLTGTPSAAALALWRQILSTHAIEWCGWHTVGRVLIVANEEKIARITDLLQQALARAKPLAPEKIKISRRGAATPKYAPLSPQEAWEQVQALVRANPQIIATIQRRDPTILEHARVYWMSFGLGAPWEACETEISNG